MSGTRLFCFAIAYLMTLGDAYLGCGIGLFFCLMQWVEMRQEKLRSERK